MAFILAETLRSRPRQRQIGRAKERRQLPPQCGQRESRRRQPGGDVEMDELAELAASDNLAHARGQWVVQIVITLEKDAMVLLRKGH